MTHIAPCADRKNDPQDWFIRPDGKQYAFDDLLTEDERRRITLSVLRKEGESADEHEGRCRLARNAARNNRKRVMLARRRRATGLCWSECPMRSECFDKQMVDRHAHGTWGGYTEEQWAEIRREEQRRARRRG